MRHLYLYRPSYKNLNRILPLLSNVGVQLIGLITGIIVARALSVEGRGYIALITTLPSVLAYALDLGIPTSFIRFGHKLDKRRIVILSASTIFAQTLLAILIVSLATSIDHSYAKYQYIILAYTAVYTPISIFTRYLQAFLMGKVNYKGSESIRLAVPISYLVFLLIGIFAYSASPTIVLCANLISNLIALCVALLYFFRVESLKEGQAYEPTTRSFITYGLRSHFSKLALFGNLRIELLIIGSRLSLKSLGNYVVALALATVIRSMAGILGNMILAEMNIIESPEHKRAYFHKRLKIVILICIFSAIFAVLMIPFVLTLLFGSDFKGAVNSAIILSLGSLVFVLSQFITEAIRAYDDTINLYISELTTSIAAAVVLVIWHTSDIHLIAIIIVLSQVSTFLWQLVLARRVGLIW